MIAVLKTPEGTHPVPMTIETGEVSIDFPKGRRVYASRNLDRQEGEEEYIAFWSFSDNETAHAEYERVFGGMSLTQRLAAAVFENADIEPGLPTTCLRFDGVSVVRVDLDKVLPGQSVIFWERYVA